MNGQKIGLMWLAPAVGACAAVMVGVTAPAHAGIIWNETTNGDLAELVDFNQASAAARGAISNVGTLTAEVSTVVGRSARTSANSNSIVDGDAIRFTVPAGMRVTTLAFTHDLAGGVREFLRVSGDTALEHYLPRAFPPVSLPGGSQNLLAQFGVPQGLEAGSYVLSFENGDPTTSTMGYGIDIVIAQVPAPGGAATLGLMVALGLRRRTRRAN
jgi:hypothetical protein